MDAVYSVNSPGSYWEFNEYDSVFHESLVSMSGNPLMVDLYRQLHFHFWMGRLILAEEGQIQKWRDSRSDHGVVLDALKNDNHVLAADMLTQHLRATRLLIDSYTAPVERESNAPRLDTSS